MVRPRRRRLNKHPLQKVRQKKARPARKVQVNQATLAACWRPYDTLAQNFAASGLTVRVNGDLSGRGFSRKCNDWVVRKVELVGDAATRTDDDRLKPMEEELDAMLGELDELFKKSDDGPRRPATADKIIAELEAEASRPEIRRLPLVSGRELEYMQKLQKKHGTDYAAMSRDIRLNFLQKTARQLEKLDKKISDKLDLKA